jgi:hypothetical protein
MTAAAVHPSALGATMLTNSIRIWWIGMRVQADPRYTGLLTCDLSQAAALLAGRPDLAEQQLTARAW